MLICGVDEAGRGPLAGPVVAAAVVMRQEYSNPEIRDSKQLSGAQRESIVSTIKRDAIAWSIIAVGPRRIERINILQATKLAMRLAVARIRTADIVLVDGNQPIDIHFPQRTVIGGDAIHVQISAASILAKTYRDLLMVELHKRYPNYGFDQHFGYPTPAHRKALTEFGPSRIHRRTFGGVRELLPSNKDQVCQLASKVRNPQAELFAESA